MATWTENGFSAPLVVGPVLADAMEQRLNFSMPLITISGEVLLKDSFLLEDPTIITDLVIHQKWGI